MLSAENLLELLQVLPDDKRKKLLLNSKLKKYSIDGYRTLKNVPIKVLSTYAAKSSLFCQIFLDLIIDEYNNLTTKDSQTFAVDEYPGILAYYFKYGMDIAPIKIRYEALTVWKTTLIISKKPGNTGISRDIRTEFTTDLLLSD